MKEPKTKNGDAQTKRSSHKVSVVSPEAGRKQLNRFKPNYAHLLREWTLWYISNSIQTGPGLGELRVQIALGTSCCRVVFELSMRCGLPSITETSSSSGFHFPTTQRASALYSDCMWSTTACFSRPIRLSSSMELPITITTTHNSLQNTL